MAQLLDYDLSSLAYNEPVAKDLMHATWCRWTQLGIKTYRATDTCTANKRGTHSNSRTIQGKPQGKPFAMMPCEDLSTAMLDIRGLPSAALLIYS